MKEAGALAHAVRVRRAWVCGDGGHVCGGLGLDAVQAVAYAHPEDVHAVEEAHLGDGAGIDAWPRQRGGDGAEVDSAPFLRSRRKRPAGGDTSVGLWGRARAVWWLPVPRELRRVLASVLLWRAARPLLVDPAAGVSASRQGRVRVYAVECSSKLAAVRSAAAQRALATPADQPSRCGCTRGGID